MDWYTCSTGSFKNRYTPITLSGNSSILALENSFLYKIESKQLIHLICDQVSRLCYYWICHTSNTHTHIPVPVTPATHTHRPCAQSTTRKGSCDRPLPVAYWCSRTKRPALRDLTSRMRMTTRGLGVSRLVCKNALHFHLDCSELFWNRITDKCSETGNSLTFKTKPKKPSLNSNNKVEY